MSGHPGGHPGEERGGLGAHARASLAAAYTRLGDASADVAGHVLWAMPPDERDRLHARVTAALAEVETLLASVGRVEGHERYFAREA